MRRPIPGWPGYEADDAGHIWTLRGREPRPLSETHVLLDRYLSVRLSARGKRTRKDVHVLVARAFHGERPMGRETRHLNGKKWDNRPINLAWGTKADNVRDKIVHGRMPYGERNGMSLAAQRRRLELNS